MENKEAFPVWLMGHGLKYEIECILKIFIPVTRFGFHYEELSALDSVSDGVVCQMEQQETQTVFSVAVKLHDQLRQAQESYPTCDPVAEKGLCEYRFSKMLFDLLCDLTGERPAWGILTGIRPVKKVQALMHQGMNHDEILAYLQEKYLITTDKLELCWNTAQVQDEIVQNTPKKSVGLYLSIPFCPTRCSYCSFVSHSVGQAGKLIPEYVRLLCEELKIWGALVKKYDFSIDSVYFGGGTPTTLSPELLDLLCNTVEQEFDLSHIREFCVEAGRPDTITREKLEVLKQHHVTRISVNPQTMHDSVLETIGRKHTTAQTVEAFRLAREVGFDNINMDLIAGLPGDTVAGFYDTLQQIFDLNPDGITIHALTLKRAANLFAVGETQIKNPVAEMLVRSREMLAERGYQPYYMYRQKNTIDNQENVGYARKGKESPYNILIMDETQSIFGAGCGASTKLVEMSCGRISRVHNYKFPYEYVRDFEKLQEKKQQVEEILVRIAEEE